MYKLGESQNEQIHARRKWIPEYIHDSLVTKAQEIRIIKEKYSTFYLDNDLLNGILKIKEKFYPSGNLNELAIKKFSSAIGEWYLDSTIFFYDTVALIPYYATNFGMLKLAKLGYTIEKYYYKSGNIMEIVHSIKRNNFSNLYHGKQLTFYENGQINCDYSYLNGKRNGVQNEYYSNGQLQASYVYDGGFLMQSIVAYDSDGTKLDPGSLNNGIGTFNEYYANGQLLSSSEYKNGLLQNVLAYFSQDGGSLNIGTFKNGSGKIRLYDSLSRHIADQHFKKGVFKKETEIKNHND